MNKMSDHQLGMGGLGLKIGPGFSGRPWVRAENGLNFDKNFQLNLGLLINSLKS